MSCTELSPRGKGGWDGTLAFPLLSPFPRNKTVLQLVSPMLKTSARYLKYPTRLL